MDILERFDRIIEGAKNPFVMEFGACDGYHSRIMLDKLQATQKKYRYQLFEPSKDMIKNIANNLQYYLGSHSDKVQFFTDAIGNKDGVSDWFQSSGNRVENGQIKDSYYGSSSIRKPMLVTVSWKDMKFEKQTCNVSKLDTHLKKHGLEKDTIDFIWADIQGAEIDLIKGGEEAFKHVKYFYTEYGKDYYEGALGKEEIISLLPEFELVEDYAGDILLRNKNITQF